MLYIWGTLLISNQMAIPRKLRNASSSPSSPAPAEGESKTPSGGGGSSGKNGNWIGYFLITTILATLWLAIRGFVLSPPSHYNGIELVIFIVVFVLTAINILFGKGGSKWISLVLAVVMGCIIWGNYNYINSSTPPTEQSAGQQEQGGSSSTTPTPEAPIARERIAKIPGKVIVLTKSKTITLPPGQKDICFSWLGYNTNGDRVNQQLTIGGVQFSTQGSNCFPVEMEGEVEVKFLNPPQTEVDTYKIIREKGGQGEYPFIKLPK
jgi:hypothetical protein